MKSRIPSLGLGIILGLVCLALAGALFTILQPSSRQFQIVTPIITIIPAPTLEPTPTYAPSLVPTPTLSADIPPDPGASISVGITVRISQTGGEGLRLRREAGKNGTPIFLGAENEVFNIKGGPKEVDGYTWWYLEAPYDSNRAGWAVSNYLAPLSP